MSFAFATPDWPIAVCGTSKRPAKKAATITTETPARVVIE
jgi:hypothetical protein